MRTTLLKAVKPRRRIHSAKVTHVSLCRKGKNQMPLLLKSGGRVQFECLSKTDKEGLLYMLVYVPEDAGVVDSDGDIASKEVVKAMAHDFLANGGNIDVEHNLQPLSTDQVRIAETLIVQKGDERFAGLTYDGKPVDPTGSWGMVLKLLDPEIRKAAESGDLNGSSLYGQAEVEIIGKAEPASPTTPNKEEFNMTPEQMQQLAEILAKALKPAAPVAPAPVQKAEIKFEGDPTKLEDIQAHEEKLFMASLDLSKAEDVAKLRARVEARKAAAQPAPAESNPRIAELEAELAQLKKASGAPMPAPKPEQGQLAETGLSKSEADQMAAGKKLAQAFQKNSK